MKLPIVVGACLVVGLAGGTFLGKKAPAAEPPVVATKPAALAPVVPVADTTRPAAPDTAAPPVPVAAAPTPAAVAMDTARLAATLSKLPPADVAPLIAGLSDPAVEAVLRKMDMPHASAVIAAMPKERGQLMSKLLLAPGSR